MNTPIRLLLTLALSAGAALAQDDRKPDAPPPPNDAPQRPERPNLPPRPEAERQRQPDGERRGDLRRDGDRRPEGRGPRDGERGNQPQPEGRRPEGAPQRPDFNGPRDGDRRPEARGPRDQGPQGGPGLSQAHRGFGPRSQHRGRRLMEQRFGMRRPDFNGPRDQGPQNQMPGDFRRGPQGGPNFSQACPGFGPRFQPRPEAPQMQRGERGPGPMNVGPRPGFTPAPMMPRGGPFAPGAPRQDDGPRHFQPGQPTPPPFQ